MPVFLCACCYTSLSSCVSQREQDTLYSSCYPRSRNEILINCVCLSADLGVRRMSSKFILCPIGLLTSAGCTVYDKAGILLSAKSGEVRDNSFLLDLLYNKLDVPCGKRSLRNPISFRHVWFSLHQICRSCGVLRVCRETRQRNWELYLDIAGFFICIAKAIPRLSRTYNPWCFCLSRKTFLQIWCLALVFLTTICSSCVV